MAGKIAILAIPPIAYVPVCDVRAGIAILSRLLVGCKARPRIANSANTIKGHKKLHRNNAMARRVCASPVVRPDYCVKRSVLNTAQTAYRKIVRCKTLFGIFAIAWKRRGRRSAARLVVERRKADNPQVDTIRAIVRERDFR